MTDMDRHPGASDATPHAEGPEAKVLDEVQQPEDVPDEVEAGWEAARSMEGEAPSG